MWLANEHMLYTYVCYNTHQLYTQYTCNIHTLYSKDLSQIIHAHYRISMRIA